MNRLACIGLLLIFSTACGTFTGQVNQIKALEDCKYQVNSVDSVYVANMNVKDLLEQEDVDLVKMPRLALALLRKNVPLKATINLAITNPSSQLAAINQFEYKVMVEKRELAGGFVNRKIAISPNGGNAVIPIQLNTNVYDLVSDEKTLDAIAGFLMGKENDKLERKSVITVKIKPTLDLANRQIKYPGYIYIDKELDLEKWL